MDDPITIRLLGPDDAGVLDRVHPDVFDEPVEPSRVWAFLQTGVNAMVVGLRAGEVVGFASGTVLMHPDKAPQLYINEVSVAEPFRQRGVARKMVRRLLDAARERGCEGFWLATEADNAAARALYRALGARETSGIVVYDWDEA